jgi:hypothetical protein
MDPGPPTPSKGSSLRLVELKAEARYARERYELYRARAYGPRPTSAGRLRELERTSKLADNRLDRAKADHGKAGSGEGRPRTTRSWWVTAACQGCAFSATAGLGQHAATGPG